MALEVTISGWYHAITALRLTRRYVQRLRQAGGDDWTDLLAGLGSGPDPEAAAAELRRLTGAEPEVAYRTEGVLLGGDALALTVTLDGQEQLLSELDEDTRPVRPAGLMRGLEPKDVLGVFARRGGGWLRCRFPEATAWEDGRLTAVCDDLAALLNAPSGLPLARRVRYDGAEPAEIECRPASRVAPLRPMFHLQS
ncbi:MAG: hypothetical protein AB7D57_02100 [Desulfovibrionaceae bacterium]